MNPLLDRVCAVLFDLDGTLVETNIDFHLMKARMVELAVRAGLNAREVQDLDILAIVDAAASLTHRKNGERDANQLRSHALGILEDIEIVHAQQTEEIPYAREMLSALAARGVPIGIVTRNCRRASELSLAMAGIEPQILISREDCLKHKPNPDPLLMALDALSATPEQSVMVGDHLMDVQSGKAAGMKTIAFLRNNRPDDFFNELAPDFVARDLREVLGAIIHCDS